jgi:hypothetical protein
MAGPTEELLQRLLTAAAELSAERIDALLREARAEAEAEVRDIVKSAVKAALLRDAVDRLGMDPKVPPARHSDNVGVAVAPAGPSETIGAPDGNPETASAWYVYGITRAGAAAPVETSGVDGGPVELLPSGRVQAIASRVSPAVFTRPPAKADDDADLAWVEREVRAHDRVLKSALAAGSVVPLRFGTVLRTREDVVRFLVVHERRLDELLGTLDGRKEWGFKVVRASEDAPEPEPAADAPAAGRAYLTHKRDRDRVRREAGQVARELAAECHRALEALADDAVVLPAPRQAARDVRSEGAVLLKAAYLVADGDEQRFRDRAAALADEYGRRGISCALTGPWPAYNFVRLDLHTEAAA